MIGRFARTAPDPYADEVIRLKPGGARSVWNPRLVLFMRLLSVVWLAKGLLAWAAILSLVGPPFGDVEVGSQAALIYFAVIDLTAAVGLWLASHWGGILWLLAVMSHLIMNFLFPRVLSNSALVFSLMIFAVMGYLTLSWLAAAEEH